MRWEMGFLICDGCQRHVKCGDAVCPFCGAGVSCAKPAGNAKAANARTRSKLLFGAVAGLVATSATASCGDSSTTVFYGAAECASDACTVEDGNQSDAIIAFYGAPNLDSGSKDATEDTTDDAADDADATDEG